MSEAIRVLVTDDHTLVRQGISHLLGGSEGFEVVGEAGSAAEALALVEEAKPDVVLLDISLPDRSGLEVAREIREKVPEAKVIMLTMHDDAAYVLKAVDVGAQGYVLKDAGPSELRSAVRAVHQGEAYFSPAVAGQLTAALRGEIDVTGEDDPLSRLTRRERDILRRVAEGKTSKEIAKELSISHRTVESHRESVMKKLEIHSVAGLTRFAVENGLV
jgi:DNA-binding NarL/FixJ family response regulator